MCAQGGSSSDSEGELAAPMQRAHPGRRARVLGDEDSAGEDEEEDPPAVAPASRGVARSGQAVARRAALLSESDDDSDWEAPKKAAAGENPSSGWQRSLFNLSVSCVAFCRIFLLVVK